MKYNISDTVTGKNYTVEFEGDAPPTDDEISDALGLVTQGDEVQDKSFSLGGLAKNAVTDTKELAQGASELVKGAINMTNPVPEQNSLVQLGKGIADAYKEGGVGGVVKQQTAPVVDMVKGAANFVQNPVETVYEKPVSTALNIIPAAKIAGESAKVAGSVASKGAKYLAKKEIASLIRPLKRDIGYGKDPVKAVLDENIIAKSKEDLVNKIDDRLHKVGKQIEKVYTNRKFAGKSIDAQQIIQPIEKELQKALEMPNENKALIDRLQGLKKDILGIRENMDGSTIATRNLSQMSPVELFELKKTVGKLTKYTNNPSDDVALNKTKQMVYRMIDSKLDANIPGIKKMNERYSNLAGALHSAENNLMVSSRRNIIGVGEMTAGAATGVATGSVGKGIIGAALNKTVGSAPFKTATAHALDKIAAPVAQGIANLGGNVSSKIPMELLAILAGQLK